MDRVIGDIRALWKNSFNAEDIFPEEGGWRPIAKQVSDLMSGLKCIPLAKVTFVSIGNGGVSYSVVKVTTDGWWERWLSTSGRFRPCFSCLKRDYKVCTVFRLTRSLTDLCAKDGKHRQFFHLNGKQPLTADKSLRLQVEITCNIVPSC